ncbi:hypothetical protein [Devosia submarina]|uniref:hypothetical protein n=1 Tax=Devosia submarina TaxID=1173082 RepID=UPI00130078A7|nr:hypothetical protein [Devosia submarina]
MRSLRPHLGRAKRLTYSKMLQLLVDYRWKVKGVDRSKSINGQPPVLISVTSYPLRFATLNHTIKSLLLQDYENYHVNLWIGEDNINKVPKDVLDLCGERFTIKPCKDLRSFTKLVPALIENPSRHIAIADDDTYYWRSWLSELVGQLSQDGKIIPCHRAHRITFTESGNIKNYSAWDHEISGACLGPDVFGTGVGGILYPPAIFDKRVTQVEDFMRLCPTADDVWFFWMARLNNAMYKNIGGRRELYSWDNTQGATSLHKTNVIEGRNDAQIRAMLDEYGWPESLEIVE